MHRPSRWTSDRVTGRGTVQRLRGCVPTATNRSERSAVCRRHRVRRHSATGRTRRRARRRRRVSALQDGPDVSTADPARPVIPIRQETFPMLIHAVAHNRGVLTYALGALMLVAATERAVFAQDNQPASSAAQPSPSQSPPATAPAPVGFLSEPRVITSSIDYITSK